MTNAILDNRLLNHPIFYTVLRIVGGIILLYKSYHFILNTVSAEIEIQQTGISFFTENAEPLALIITCLGLLCGFFITVGLYTKAAAIIQIPVLIVAVFFINIKRIGDNYFEFFLSIVMLLLLILFAFKGNGPLSAGEYFRRGARIDQRVNQERVPDHL